MTFRFNLPGLLAGLAALLAVSSTASAALVTVAYDGDYNEATEAPSGDYDAIGGLTDVGVFDLMGSSTGFANTFSGSVVSPSDTSDFFVIRVGAGQTLTGASLVLGTNVTPSNPMFAFPAPHWSMELPYSTTPTIFDSEVGYDRMSSATTYGASFAPLGEGIYNILIGNGVFGTNNGALDYTMTFTVTGADISVVPLPAALPLYGAGIALLGFLGWRRKRS